MKKLLFTLTIAAAAFCAMTFTSCEKKETAGQKLDNAIDSTNKAASNFTKKAEEAAQDTNDAVSKAIKDIQK
ncbi:MAG: hypothetical protein J6Y92_02225 [Lentisphaeria bacterium]|nr:hypothetical protein [Lentisphaeria bacterium]